MGFFDEGWAVYDARKEFERQGALNQRNGSKKTTKSTSRNPKFVLSTINHDYKFCSSYPDLLLVPDQFDNPTVLENIKTFRSKVRNQCLR